MSDSGKSEQEHIHISFEKGENRRKFLDVSRCSHAKQLQGNVRKSVLRLDLLLFFTVLVKGTQRLFSVK